MEPSEMGSKPLTYEHILDVIAEVSSAVSSKI